MSDDSKALAACPPTVSYTHHDLVIHTHAFYTLQRGKRVYCPKPAEVEGNSKPPDSWFEIEGDLYPPLMLMPKTWMRYGYTIEDVHNTYEKMDASYMWQIALMLLCGTYEPEAVSAGVRPTFQSMFTFLFISRKNVFDAFLDSQSASISKRVGSSLCHERPDHKPLLPKITVPDALFNECKFMVPPDHPSFRRVTLYDHVVPFQDIFMVPVEFDDDHNLVYMVRVVPKDVYDAIPVLPKACVITMPWLARVDNQVFVMLEEACFFATDLRDDQADAERSAVKKRKQLAKKSAHSIKKRKT